MQKPSWYPRSYLLEEYGRSPVTPYKSHKFVDSTIVPLSVIDSRFVNARWAAKSRGIADVLLIGEFGCVMVKSPIQLGTTANLDNKHHTGGVGATYYAGLALTPERGIPFLLVLSLCDYQRR